MKAYGFGAGVVVKTGRFREGIAFDAKKLDTWMINGGLKSIMLHPWKSTGAMQNEGDFHMGDIETAYEEGAKVVGNAHDAYNKAVRGFRDSIKNDLASISSSADRVQKENAKIKAAYEGTAQSLLTPEMERAIVNAERLATALKAISDLQNHSITFAVLDKKTTA